MTNELKEVNQIRLDEDLSVPFLAGEIGLTPSALHRLLFTPGRKPRDRTLHKIRRYLAERRSAPAPKRRKRRAADKAAA